MRAHFLMKAYLSKLIIFLLLVSLFIPLVVEGIEIKNPLKYESFGDLIENIVRFLFWLSLFVGALMIVVAAYCFLTSAGDPEKVKRAKNIIIWTLVGILVLFLSVAFVAFLKEALGVKPTSWLLH